MVALALHGGDRREQQGQNQEAKETGRARVVLLLLLPSLLRTCACLLTATDDQDTGVICVHPSLALGQRPTNPWPPLAFFGVLPEDSSVAT